MEDSKKPIMVGIVVVCLAAAGLISYFTYFKGSGGTGDIPADEMTWVKCSNNACKAEYQISMRDYYKYLKEYADPFSSVMPPLVCNKCNQKSIYKAEKCGNPQCGIVFFTDSVRGDFSDRCPKCKRSETEESRKKRMSGQRG